MVTGLYVLKGGSSKISQSRWVDLAYFCWTVLFQNVLLIGALPCLLSVLFSILLKNNWLIYAVAVLLFFYSFLSSDRHLGLVIIVFTPKSLLTIDLHFTAISTVPILSLCVLFFPFSFSYRTKSSIN